MTWFGTTEGEQKGGARLRRASAFLSAISVLPTNLMHAAFVWPVFNSAYKPFPNWILLHIAPLGGIVLILPQAMMPATRLELPLRPTMPPPEFALPIRYPLLNLKTRFTRLAKQMHVVGHDQIITHQPRSCRQPRLAKQTVRFGVGQPRLAMLCRHGQKDDVRLTGLEMNARRGIAATLFDRRHLAVHTQDQAGWGETLSSLLAGAWST